MSWLLVYPILIPLLTAVLSYLFRNRPPGAGSLSRGRSRSCWPASS